MPSPSKPDSPIISPAIRDDESLASHSFAVASYTMDRRHRSIKGGDAMPMWIELRISELSGNPFLETLGYEMFQAFRFIVKFVQGIIQDLVKKGLNQPMMTNDLEGTPLPGA
jgi:hypothetical protein